ncbi:MAG: C40 family peptidase [Saprospiraceae bacterium]|nr:C40 family peptidase [Saprospiraceae bacterium]
MMKKFWIILFTLYSVSCGNNPLRQTIDPEILIDEIGKEFAPDKRVAHYSIQHQLVKDQVVLSGETTEQSAKVALVAALKAMQVDLVDSAKLLVADPGLVNVSVCNIRAEPRHASELVTQSLLGTPLRIYKYENGWYYVQTPDQYLGWMDAGGLEILSDALSAQWRRSEKIVVTAPFDFVKSSISKDNISDVTEGNILRVLGSQSNFYQVALPDGRAGLLRKSSAQPYHDFLALNEPLVENILDKAREFLGRPYLWGGTSGKAMDCSGFTKTVFYLNGLVLPRDASQQVHVGDQVETDSTLRNLEPGDLLFFGRKAIDGNPDKVTHVSIYLGDGKMIHSSERVQIQSLVPGDPNFAPKRLKTFLGARRMLDNVGINGVIPLSEHSDYKT